MIVTKKRNMKLPMKIRNKKVGIPFLETIIRTILYSVDNYKLFFRASIFWFVLIIYETIMGFPIIIAGDTSLATYFISLTILLMAISSISVYTYKYILLGENKTGINISFARKEFKFFSWTFLMMFWFFLPIFITVLRLNALTTNPISTNETIVTYLCVIGYYMIFSRLMLIFPFVVVDNENAKVSKIIKFTKSNTLKLFFAFILMIIFWSSIYSCLINFIKILELKIWFSDFLSMISLLICFYLFAFFHSIFYAHVFQCLRYHSKKLESKD